jgi:hypothetical protein
VTLLRSGRAAVPDFNQGLPSYEVLAALVVSLRAMLAGSQAALARVAEELAQARERIAELEGRLTQNSRFSELQAVGWSG